MESKLCHIKKIILISILVNNQRLFEQLCIAKLRPSLHDFPQSVFWSIYEFVVYAMK